MIPTFLEYWVFSEIFLPKSFKMDSLANINFSYTKAPNEFIPLLSDSLTVMKRVNYIFLMQIRVYIAKQLFDNMEAIEVMLILLTQGFMNSFSRNRFSIPSLKLVILTTEDHQSLSADEGLTITT